MAHGFQHLRCSPRCAVATAVPAAWAQQASSIAGVVRDTAGLAIPGVTVEASSPALIDKTRTVVTDGEGRYQIVDFGRAHTP